jgi:hypothetical protein
MRGAKYVLCRGSSRAKEDAVDCWVDIVESEDNAGGENALIDDIEDRGWLWKACPNPVGVSGAFKIPDWLIFVSP